MKFSRRRLLLATLVGAALLAAWGLRRPHGPTYQGRDVRGWLALRADVSGPFHNDEFVATPDVLAALRAMGTNAFPELVEIALELESPPKQLILGAWLTDYAPWLMKKLPDTLSNWLRYRSNYLPDIAMAALGELRPPAVFIFPRTTNELRRITSIASFGWEFEMSMMEYRRRVLFQLLGYVGDERETAARMLAPLVVSTNDAISGSARVALANLGLASAVAVPQLMMCLTNASRSFHATTCLRYVGLGASNALPLLRRNYEATTKPYERMRIAFTATAIDSREFWAEGLMQTLLMMVTNRDSRLAQAPTGRGRGIQRTSETDDQEFRRWAVDALRYHTNVAPRFEGELAALARAGREEIASEALAALAKANVDPIRKIPVLSDCLSSTNATVRAVAAGWLLELQPTNALAFAGVTNALSNHEFQPTGEGNREWLVVHLVKLGPAAAPALPLIRRHYSRFPPDSAYGVYDAALLAAALRTIEGKP